MARLIGEFMEICSCDVVCGCCWLDRTTFENMTCSGLSLWVFEQGSLIGDVDVAGADVDVAGAKACCVSTHFGSKARPIRAALRLFIDAKSDKVFRSLATAFEKQTTTKEWNPLAVVARMNGARLTGLDPVVAERAQITVTGMGMGSANPAVSVRLAGGPELIQAKGCFDGASMSVPTIDSMSIVDIGYAKRLLGAPTLEIAPGPAALPFIELNIAEVDSRSATRARFDTQS